MQATADFFLATTRQALGTAGEMKVKEALEASGFTVDASHPYKCGDLRVFDRAGNILYVEVKTARSSRSKTREGFNFSLYRKIPNGRVCTDHRGTDYTILLCVLKSGNCVPFVIPTREIARITQITVPPDTWNYAGKYARFRQNINELRLQ